MKKCKQCKSEIKNGNTNHKTSCSYQAYDSLPPSLWTYASSTYDSGSSSCGDSGSYSDGGSCA